MVADQYPRVDRRRGVPTLVSAAVELLRSPTAPGYGKFQFISYAGLFYFFLPRYTSSVTGSPCVVVLFPIVTNSIVKFSFGAAPCQWKAPPGM